MATMLSPLPTFASILQRSHSAVLQQPYRIELWDDRDTRVELITVVADHAVAPAAFVETVRRRPGNVIILRQKSRVLADSLSKLACASRERHG